MNNLKSILRSIVARAYCYEPNTDKELDAHLLEAVVDELLKSNEIFISATMRSFEDKPNIINSKELS